jgi:hypothetical protein
MTWVIKVTHMDEAKNQIAFQVVVNEDDHNFSKFDVRIEYFKEMLARMEAHLKEMKNT